MDIVVGTDLVAGSAQVDFEELQQRKLAVGAWCEVKTSSLIYFCRLWPALVGPGRIIVDACLTMERENGEIDENQDVTICALTTSTAVQVNIRVDVQPGSREEQLNFYGFVYEQGSTRQQCDTVRHILDGMVVKKGTIVRPSMPSGPCPLSIKILETHPKDAAVMVSSGTRIKQASSSNTDAKTARSSVAQLEASMGALRVEDDGAGSANSANFTSDDKPYGLERAYDALIEMVSYPFAYQAWMDKLSVESPKGILLYGPPGVGKTFLVSSIATRYGARLLVINGPELYGPYVGESEEQLRIRFKQAQDVANEEKQPVILFIDEIDALTPRREDAQSHENRMVAQLLTLMDGVTQRGKLIVVGATNRPNAIDPALRRPGRFDREIHIDAPDALTRQRLLASQMRSMPVDPALKLVDLAASTNGYVAADLSAVCREAAYHAIQRQMRHDGSLMVTMDDFRTAMANVGPSMQRGYQINVENTSWDDVGGLDQVKKQLKQAVEWPLVYKSTFSRLGLKPPRGILMYGPPGCSKTTLVKVIASVSGASFLSINGAQLYSPYVGDSEKVIRATFQRARAAAPAIIFLDETEAIVGKRNLGDGGAASSGDSVQERVLSTLLNEMDGVETAENVLVIGATNRPDMLDAALLRPGRFDRLIYVPPPDVDARLDILQIHCRKMPVDSHVDLQVLALMTEMYTGADLQNVCREAAMMALRRDHNAQQVTTQDFEEALATIPASITPEILHLYDTILKNTGRPE